MEDLDKMVLPLQDLKRVLGMNRPANQLASKYQPHQGAGEIARRKRQMDRDAANAARRATVA